MNESDATLIFFLFFITICTGNSQNLIPNHSFEELRNLPVNPNPRNNCDFEPYSGYRAFQRNLNYWFAGSKTTPDLRITSAENYKACRRKYKDCNKARTGKNSAGLVTYMLHDKTDNYREYLEIKLKRPLKPNVKTYIQFWVSRDREAKLVSNNMGFYFSVNKLYADILEPINLEPIFNQDSILNHHKKEWVKIESSFIPDKAFSFLTIGNFFDNEHTQVEEFENYTGPRYSRPYAYYFIDDVYVWQEGDAKEEKPLVFENIEVKPEEVIQLKNIEFEHNSSVLKEASFGTLNKLLIFLQDYPEVRIAIHGHTNNIGNSAYNLRLSKSRAKAVYDFLITKKLDEKRLVYDGFGDKRPLESNATVIGLSKNRRVEFFVLED